MNFDKILRSVKESFQNPSIVGNLLTGRSFNEGLPRFGGVAPEAQAVANPNIASPIPAPDEVTRGMEYQQRAVQAQPKDFDTVLGMAQAPVDPVGVEQIQKGWDRYGNPPAATASAKFAEVNNKYPILQKYPGLLPSMAIKESSGGKANTKNWFNWALYNDDYQEKDPLKVIEDVARAVGSDDSPSSHYYKKFRETEDVGDMLARYAPPTENDTELYHKQILDWMKMFE